MGRRFKNVSVNQLEELMNKLNEKMKAGCSIEDALMYVQAYAAAEELKDIKSKGPLFDWKISKAWYACGYGDRIKDIVAWMEVPDYEVGKRA